MAYRPRRTAARRTSYARPAYRARRGSGGRNSGRRVARRTSARVQTVKLVIQAGPTQQIADPGTGAIVKKAGKARF